MATSGYPELNAAEKHVLHHKGTERPFTGAYESFFEPGMYVCKACGFRLFDADHKFSSHCGWPSFDDALAGAVARVPDADGVRVEIVCAQCRGHLGHVFEGEGYTPRNTRHCVNSLSVCFEPSHVPLQAKACFAAGCFWGVEHFFSHQPGVLSTRCVYTHGRVPHPSYAQVCSGTTGHYEAVEVVFDPSVVSYDVLVQLFFEIHDPTDPYGQGVDVGSQYMSAVFFEDAHQKAVAEHWMGLLRDKGMVLATALLPAAEVYPAEDVHQQYLQKHPERPVCHVRVKRF